MTTYKRLVIAGVDYSDDIERIFLERSLDENNSSGSFTIYVNNSFGKNAGKFNLNDEVVIYADIDVNPATTKLFTGVIEKVDYPGKNSSETITLVGRDYEAILQDKTVEPVAYRNVEVSEIVLGIMNENISEITTNNVNVTNTTIDRISFNHISVFDALIELAQSADFYFYVDEDLDLHFEEKSVISSGETINSTNILNGNVSLDDNQIYNRVWVYGERTLTGANEQFIADGVGSVFNLDAKPYQTSVFQNDNLLDYGGVFEINDPANGSPLQYLVDFDKRDIIFVSGVAAGDSIPISGDDISIDYQRSTPVISFKTDAASIGSYGTKEKIMFDRSITSFSQAVEKATTFLNENKDPKISVTAQLKDLLHLTPGNTIIVDIPYKGISNETYSIAKIKYNFLKDEMLDDGVLTVRLNRRIADITDTLKEIILQQRKLAGADIETNLTKFESVTTDVVADYHYELYEIPGAKHPFKFQSEGANILNSDMAVLGPWENGSALITSGGTF